MISRYLKLLRRRAACRSIGLQFDRQRNFKLPSNTSFNDGTQVAFPENQLGIADDFINILLDDEYGVRSVKNAPRTVVDIGANIGLFSLHASRHWPLARIVSYEPNPAAFEFAKMNALRCNVTNAAVGITSGKARYEGEDWRLGKILSDESGSIPIIALSNILKELGGRIDFLKLDCEGHEWELFKDSSSFAFIDRIHMEYHLIEGKTFELFRKTVSRLGYDIVKCTKHSSFGLAWLVKKAS